ncbi:MAG: urease accessory protein UreE [Pseudomonadota bacterium]
MIRAHGLRSAQDGDGITAQGVVTLEREARYRRRGVLTTEAGETLLLDLPEATELEHGALLMLEDGRAVEVRAAPEPLLEIRAEDARHLARLAWHIGNRHLPAEVQADRLLIQRDHVIAEMVRRLGGMVAEVTEPFRPEGGAYGHGRTHGHHHAHDAHADPNAHIPHRHD